MRKIGNKLAGTGGLENMSMFEAGEYQHLEFKMQFCKLERKRISVSG